MIEILDTPGLFDTSKPNEEITSLVMQALAGMNPGPDAILYVIRIERYTEEEYGMYTRIKELLGESVTKYLVVVFTFGDDFRGKNISDILDKAPPSLQTVMKECDNRYVVIDNINKPQQQVDDLLKMVKEMRSRNGLPYGCSKYAVIAGKVEEEVQRRMAEVEKRELQSKKRLQQLMADLEQSKEMAAKEKAEFQKRDEEGRKEIEEQCYKTEETRRKLQQLMANLEQTKEIAAKEKAEFQKRDGERRKEIEFQCNKTEEMRRKLDEELKSRNLSEKQHCKQREDLINQIKAAENRHLEEKERQREEEEHLRYKIMRLEEELTKLMAKEVRPLPRR